MEWTGFRYFITVYNLYWDDVLTDEDISLFDEELKDRLIVLKERFNSDK